MKTAALCILLPLQAGALGATSSAPRPDGDDLRQAYTERLEELRASLTEALPQVSEERRTAYLEARAAEKAAKDAVAAAQKDLDAIGSARGLVGHAKGKWIGGADKGIAAARAKLAKATNDAEREAAEKDLAHWEQNRRDGVAALEERQAKLDALLVDAPSFEEDMAAARRAEAEAVARTLEATAGLRLARFLSSSQHDAALAEFIVLHEATPAGLAAFAGQGEEHAALVGRLLSDEDLLLQMVTADGAKSGAYGAAMKIYADIQTTSRRARKGALQPQRGADTPGSGVSQAARPPAAFPKKAKKTENLLPVS